MKRTLSILLVATLILTLLCGVASAETKEYTHVPFEASLTIGMGEKFEFSKPTDWLQSDFSIAVLGTLLPLDIIADDTNDLDIGEYKVKTGYVGISESGILTCLYRSDVNPSALIIVYNMETGAAQFTVSQLNSVPTDSDLNTAMNNTCVQYSKIDEESASEVAQIILGAMED